MTSWPRPRDVVGPIKTPTTSADFRLIRRGYRTGQNAMVVFAVRHHFQLEIPFAAYQLRYAATTMPVAGQRCLSRKIGCVSTASIMTMMIRLMMTRDTTKKGDLMATATTDSINATIEQYCNFYQLCRAAGSGE